MKQNELLTIIVAILIKKKIKKDIQFIYITVPVVYRLAQRSYEPLDWVQFPTGIYFLFNNFLNVFKKLLNKNNND